MSNSPICSQVRDLDGEEDRSAGVCAAGGSGGGQAQDGDDGVRLPHGSRNETHLEAPAFIFHSRLLFYREYKETVLGTAKVKGHICVNTTSAQFCFCCSDTSSYKC